MRSIRSVRSIDCRRDSKSKLRYTDELETDRKDQSYEAVKSKALKVPRLNYALLMNANNMPSYDV
jgi:hypothetical protein